MPSLNEMTQPTAAESEPARGCSTTPPAAAAPLIDVLSAIVGRRHCLVGKADTDAFTKGFRSGSGDCLAVVRPGSLVEQWRVVVACVAADVITILQAGNTGLTGGSTPHPEGYDRDVVIISTLRMTGFHLLGGGRQVLCLPGSTLFALEKVLKPLQREPHSVIGSTCFGASVLGGICNNSGGALVKRGPAYTELALFARAQPDGNVQLVNHLDIELGADPEEILRRVERGDFSEADVLWDAGRNASDPDYADHVRQVDAPTPARFNADPRRLFEASGSAGHIVLFAVRLDTFRAEGETDVVCLGSSEPEILAEVRRDLLSLPQLPIAAEYIHRDAFRIAERYGKDMFLTIQVFGTERLPTLLRWKAAVDRWAGRIPGARGSLLDQVTHFLASLLPNHLPVRLRQLADDFEHLLMIRAPAGQRDALVATLERRIADRTGRVLVCTKVEGAKAFLQRYVTAGAAVRYRDLHASEVEDILALDIALPRNARDWFEALPPDIDAALSHKLYYGHFLCHVFHQDYIVRRGHDVTALEHQMWSLLDDRGAEYPAEHNVGHLYPAKPPLVDHYRALDPGNVFNPGVGLASRKRDWSCD